MGQSNRIKFAGREAELTNKIKLFGTSPVSDQEGVSLESMWRYAEDVLGIKNPPVVTDVGTKNLSELTYSFVGALFERFSEQNAEIQRLRLENEQMRKLEDQKKMAAKLQVMQMMAGLKGQNL